MKKIRFILVMTACAACLAALAAPAGADQARAYLILASNEVAATDAALKEFEPALKQVFGYKSHRLLAADAADLRGNTPVSLTLEKGMSVHVVTLGMEHNVRHLDVTIKQGITKLLQSKMRMTGGAPLFIRCQERAEGLLIIVLVVR